MLKKHGRRTQTHRIPQSVKLVSTAFDCASVLGYRLVSVRRGCYHAMEMEISFYPTVQLHGRLFEYGA